MRRVALMSWLLVEESATAPCPLLMLCHGHAMVDCLEVPAVLIVAELVVWCRKLMLWLLVEAYATVPCPRLMLCYGHTLVDCFEVPAVLIVAELVVWCSKLMLWLLVEEGVRSLTDRWRRSEAVTERLHRCVLS